MNPIDLGLIGVGILAVLTVVAFISREMGKTAERLRQSIQSNEVSDAQKQAAVDRPTDDELDKRLSDGRF